MQLVSMIITDYFRIYTDGADFLLFMLCITIFILYHSLYSWHVFIICFIASINLDHCAVKGGLFKQC